jgi:hypothetical protein
MPYNRGYDVGHRCDQQYNRGYDVGHRDGYYDGCRGLDYRNPRMYYRDLYDYGRREGYYMGYRDGETDTYRNDFYRGRGPVRDRRRGRSPVHDRRRGRSPVLHRERSRSRDRTMSPDSGRSQKRTVNVTVNIQIADPSAPVAVQVAEPSIPVSPVPHAVWTVPKALIDTSTCRASTVPYFTSALNGDENELESIKKALDVYGPTLPKYPFEREYPKVAKYESTLNPPSPSEGCPKHVVFVLTSASEDHDRCKYIKECLEKDDNDNMDEIHIVMAARDYNNKTYLCAIGLSDMSSKKNVIIHVVPDGPKTAGYTRSWCVYLASTLDCSEETVIWIRDDRRCIYPARGKRRARLSNDDNSTLKEKTASMKNVDLNGGVLHGIVYSPIGQMANCKSFDTTYGDWTSLNQVYCCTARTWQLIQKLMTYPQGPILEDYYFARLLHDAGFTCADMGNKVVKRTGDCESNARPGDTGKRIYKLPYDDQQMALAMQMAHGLQSTLMTCNERTMIKFQIGESEQTFSLGGVAHGGGQYAVLAVQKMEARVKQPV